MKRFSLQTILPFLLIIFLFFTSLGPVLPPAPASANDEAGIPVTIRIEASDRTLVPEQELEVCNFDMSPYGVAIADTPRVLHALIQALDFDNSKLQLGTFGESYLVEEIMGVKSTGDTGGWMYTVNNVSPTKGVYEYVLAEGDYIVLYFVENWSDSTYTWFADMAKTIRTGENLELILLGNSWDPLTWEPVTGPVAGAQIIVNDTPYQKDGESVVTSVYGKATLSFDQPGIKRITATRVNQEGKINISRPFRSIHVLEPSGLAEEALKKTIGYYKDNKRQLNDWGELVALRGAGEELNGGAWILPAWNSNVFPAEPLETDYAGYILGLLAREEDPNHAWDQRNLVQELIERQKENGAFGDWINQHIWSMIALDTVGADYDRGKALEYLLDQQLADGGYTLWGKTGDPDMTGMGLMALGNYRNLDQARQAIDKALTFLQSIQEQNAGFASWGSNNSMSVATILSGLIAVGENPLGESWKKGTRTMIDCLVDFQPENGSFTYDLEDITSNSMATYQALQALGDFKYEKPVWSRLGETAVQQPLDRLLEVIAEAEQILNQAVVGDKPGQYPLLAKHTLQVSIDTARQVANNPTATQFLIENTGLDLIEALNHFTPSVIPDPGSGDEITGTVTMSVTGDVRKGTILPGTTVQLRTGETVYTVLQKVLDEKNISLVIGGSGSSIYVRSIGGLAEFDLGPQSGWVFSVNGRFPNIGAGSYKLKAGDEVEWIYTTDLGKDVGAPQEKIELPAGKKVDKEMALEVIGSISQQIGAKKDLSEWEAFALARVGKSISPTYVTGIEQLLQVKEGKLRKVTDYARLVLVLGATETDPTSFAGFDLIREIYNNQNMLIQGANGPIFALIALDSGNYPVPANALWTREKLIDWILLRQNKDGGYSLETGGKSETDLTAMALTALAPYQERIDVQKAVIRAIDWLADQQLPSGGFKLFGEENSESVAQVIIALTALGKDPLKPPFVQKEGNLLENLFSFRNKDGAFSHLRGEKSNPLASEQVLTALLAYTNYLEGKRSIYDLGAVANGDRAIPEIVDREEISPWALEEVTKAINYGLVQGISTEEIRFAPRQRLTRAQFSVILLRLLGLEDNEEMKPVFSDVSPEAWYYKAVINLYQKGIVKGVGPDTFLPDRQVSRQEVALMLTRALNLPECDLPDFKDLDQLSAETVSSISAVAGSGIMVGHGGYFHPGETLTREATAVIAVRIYEKEN